MNEFVNKNNQGRVITNNGVMKIEKGVVYKQVFKDNKPCWERV